MISVPQSKTERIGDLQFVTDASAIGWKSGQPTREVMVGWPSRFGFVVGELIQMPLNDVPVMTKQDGTVDEDGALYVGTTKDGRAISLTVWND